MSRFTTDDMDSRIGSALKARALSIDVAVVPDLPAQTAPRRSRMAVTAASAIALAVIGGLVAVTIVVADSGSQSTIRATSADSTGAAAAPAADAPTSGLVRLPAGASETTDRLVRYAEERAAPGYPITAMQADGAFPVVAYHEKNTVGDGVRGCFAIDYGPPMGGQGSCSSPENASTELLVSSRDYEVFYLAWSEVPVGTTQVVVSYGGAEQRVVPIDGAVYVVVTEKLAALVAAPPVARAYDGQGQLLGEAQIAPSLIEMGRGMAGG